MLTLIIDSATKKLYFGLVEDKKVLIEKYYEGKNDHAKKIVSGLNDLLKEVNKEIANLDSIVCGVGPGSYTGVRMAVTVAKMIAHFKKVELRAISTLQLMGSNVSNALVSIDARRGYVFGAIVSNAKFCVNEAYILLDDLSKYEHSSKVDEGNFVVNPLNVIENSYKVEEPLLLTPNYLRDTEAERNLC